MKSTKIDNQQILVKPQYLLKNKDVQDLNVFLRLSLSLLEIKTWKYTESYFKGQGKPSGYHEQASVVVETVTKTSVMSKFSGLQKFQSDASRCTAEGNGLKKAFRGKQATFSVDTSQAGKCGVATSQPVKMSGACYS